jgi:pimeloyl-ACP methyl ester carboxylesterase
MDAYADRWWTSHDGLKLYARDYAGAGGDAKLPVVCIHGLTRSSFDFEEVAPAIAETGRRVIVPDVRGRGRSAWDREPMNYHLGSYALDMAAMLDRMGVARAVFIGTSMGGLITLTLSTIRGDLIAGAALNDVGPELSPVGLKRIAGYAGGSVVQTWTDAIDYARRINGLAFPRYGDADWERFAHRLFREDEAGRPVLNYDPDILAPIKAAGEAALAPDLWPLFEVLVTGRPTLLVRGETSDLLDRSVAERMRVMGTMRFVEARGVGHAPMLTEPEVMAALQEFLAACP